MKLEIKIPAVGESVTEATVSSWSKQNGELVKRNEVVLLVETDKASVEVIAEQDGVLEIKAEAGKVVPIGAVVGYLDTTASPSVSAPHVATGSPLPSTPQAPTPVSTPPQGATAHFSPEAHLSPAVQRVVSEKGLDPSQIQGSGRGGRLTKEDAVKASSNANAAPIAATAMTPANAATASATAPASVIAKAPTTLPGNKQGQVERVPMSTIRRRIAEKLVEAQRTAAILTTFNEINMSRAMEIRSKYKDAFKEKYGVNFGFMSLFTKAAIEALKTVPAVNATIEGTDIVYKKFYNIGVAVGTEKGLIVPVIKDADMLSIAGIETAIKNFALKSRDGKITIDDLSNGTFTISNGGVYGSLMSTPILNYPQVGILGMHKIEERPIAINGKVEIRPMMYLALSYDHRIIDGKEAVTFLVRVKECIENPERLLFDGIVTQELPESIE
jgi:2-oxoglutarate dehydrogenase E2 component (dihydrolipoamide succinyltransferase)